MYRLCATSLLMAALFTTTTLKAGSFKDVEYGRAGDVSLRMDAQTPEGPGPHPAVIIVHGGGWIRGDRVWNVQPLFAPLHDAGYAWFSISYRLATDFMQFGVAAEDVKAAIHYVRANAANYNVDPDRIAVVGESAGAHLGALATLDEPKSVAAMVSLYGPMDLEELAKTSPVVPPQIRDALNTAFGPLLQAHMRSLSPASHVTAAAPPFLLIHGTSDSVVPIAQSTAMQQKLKAAGVPADLITVPGAGHGIRYWNNGASASWEKQMIRWLDKTLQVPR